MKRHATSLGITDQRVYLVTEDQDKAGVTFRVKGSVVVDDRPDGLRAQARGAYKAGSLKKGVLFGDNRWDADRDGG